MRASLATQKCLSDFRFQANKLVGNALFHSILRVIYGKVVRSALDGQVAVLGLPGALVRQVNRAFGERLRAGKAETRGQGPFTEESLAGAEK